MLGSNYYFGSIRKYATVFGLLFDNININRSDDTGKELQAMRVPLTWAPKDKILVRLQQEPDIDKTQPALTLPRMSFEMAGTIYNGDRKLPKMNIFVTGGDDPNHVRKQFVPVAYDLIFRLYVYAKNLEDGNKIVEQIIPFFCPDYTVKVDIIPQMGKVFDIPIALRSIVLEDNFAGNYIDRRQIIWTLDFNMQAWIFGPVFTTPLIKFVDTNFRFGTPTSNTTILDDLAANNIPDQIIEQVIIQPGLTANGQPTNKLSESVPANTIWYYQNWGIIETIT